MHTLLEIKPPKTPRRVTKFSHSPLPKEHASKMESRWVEFPRLHNERNVFYSRTLARLEWFGPGWRSGGQGHVGV
jgi:hypothetical protein